jgi:uncharacterized RDD family membrane protein YckC
LEIIEKMAVQSSEFDFNHWLYRFLALLIDSIIAYIPAYIIYIVVSGILWPVPAYYSAWGLGGMWTPWWAIYVLFLLIGGVIQMLYFVILEVSRGATVGKTLLGLQVKMVNGSKLEFGKSFIRNISKIYGLFLLLDWLIGIVTPGADRHQKYTDRMAGTTVVSIKQPFAAAPPPPPPPT